MVQVTEHRSGSDVHIGMTGFVAFDTASHSDYIRIVSTDVRCAALKDGKMPLGSGGIHEYIRTEFMSMAWRMCGLVTVAPALDPRGCMEVVRHEYVLQDRFVADTPARTDGLWMAAVVHASPHAGLVAFLEDVLRYLRCQPSTHVVVDVVRHDDVVTVDFYVAVHTPNSCPWLRLVTGTNLTRVKKARRPSKARRLPTCEPTLDVFRDTVVASGWHGHVAAMLAHVGVALPPYPHQSAALLAMLEMEGLSSICADRAVFGAAAVASPPPAIGKRGVSWVLSASTMDLGSAELCTLTGRLRPHGAQAQPTTTGGILCSPSGSGKSYICIAYAALTSRAVNDSDGAAPETVVVAPACIVPQWRAAVARILPSSSAPAGGRRVRVTVVSEPGDFRGGACARLFVDKQCSATDVLCSTSTWRVTTTPATGRQASCAWSGVRCFRPPACPNRASEEAVT